MKAIDLLGKIDVLTLFFFRDASVRRGGSLHEPVLFSIQMRPPMRLNDPPGD